MMYKLISMSVLSLITIQAIAQDDPQVRYLKPLDNFEVSKPALTLNGEKQSAADSNFRFHMITGYREGVEPVKRQHNFNIASKVNEKQGTINLSVYNASIEELLTHAVVPASYVILEVKDPSKYRYNERYGSKLEWLRKNAYCYELTVPRSLFKTTRYIEDDVASYFGLEYLKEKRKVKILTLSFADRSVYYANVSRLKKETAVSFGQLSSLLADAGFPVLDTNIGGIYLIFNLGADFKIQSGQDLSALKQRLKQQGLNLTEESVERTVYIIREKK